MRHVVVTRVSIFLAALFVAAAAVFAWLTRSADAQRPTITTPDGLALFETHCASCHTASDLRSTLRGLNDARRHELEQFLNEHGDAAPEDDRRILDELRGKNSRQPH